MKSFNPAGGAAPAPETAPGAIDGAIGNQLARPQPKRWWHLTRQQQETFGGIGLLLPLLLVITLIVVWPVIQGIWLSFTDAYLLRPKAPAFVGLANYVRFFTDPFTKQYVTNTLIWSLGKIAGQFVLGLTLALLVNRPIRFRAFWRAILLVPWAMPVVVTSMVWRWILDGSFGILNKILMGIGLLNHPVTWLADAATLWPTVITVHTWQFYPFMYVSFLAGLQMISNDLYEAGELDGTGVISAFRYITWPMLRPQIAVNGLVAIIWSLGDFSAIWTLTQGGPGGLTTTLAPRVYLTTFKFFDTSYGATMAVILMLATIILTAIYLTRVRFDVDVD